MSAHSPRAERRGFTGLKIVSEMSFSRKAGSVQVVHVASRSQNELYCSCASGWRRSKMDFSLRPIDMSLITTRSIHRCSCAVIVECIECSTAIFWALPSACANSSSSWLTRPTVICAGSCARGLQRFLIAPYTTSGKLPCSVRWKPLDGFFQLSIACASAWSLLSESISTYILASCFCFARYIGRFVSRCGSSSRISGKMLMPASPLP
mmetsp:Transcript_73919/g.203520  ORF Transcript_73919/g.203520 Transcript_73919/m.203520 type:complete len:208 (-) Transcript_73919:156-779(-)